jgi:hypothetical protein
MADENDDTQDDEPDVSVPHPRVMQAWDTPNPHLGRIFQHPNFGAVPAKAIELLERVSPDPDELLVYAVRTRHGQLKRGYLLLTTQGGRWVQTLPVFSDDLFSLNWKIEYKRLGLTQGLLVTADGNQFQMMPGKAKAYRELFYQVAQAVDWEAANAQAPSTQPESSDNDLTAKLRGLSELHDQGALSDDEFAQAKARLLGT